MELCFVQRRFLMPRSLSITLARWNHEYSKHTKIRRYNIYPSGSNECAESQTFSCRKRPAWLRPQHIRLFRNRPESLQTSRMQPEQMQSSRSQSVFRLTLESQPQTGKLESGYLNRNRSGVVQLDGTPSSSISKTLLPLQILSKEEIDDAVLNGKQIRMPKGLVSEDTVSDAQQRSALPVVSLTSESQTNTVSRPTSVAIDCDSSSNGSCEKHRPTKSDRLHSTGRDTTQGAKMLDEDLVQLLQQGQREAFTTPFQSGKIGYSLLFSTVGRTGSG